MKKLLLLLTLCLIFCVNNKGQSFDPDELYAIVCYDSPSGGVEPANDGVYPLIYNSLITQFSEHAFWTIKEEMPGKYSFRNSVTNQYIQYAPDEADAKYIAMSDLQDGNTTLFNLVNQQTENGISYWSIQCFSNEDWVLDKRSYGAIGPYEAHYRTNQWFTFKGKSEFAVGESSRLSDYFYSFTLENKPLALDTNTDTYYCSLPIEQMDTDVTQIINFISKDDLYTLVFDEEKIENNNMLTFENVVANKEYIFQIKKEDIGIGTIKIIFTGLPIVQLYTEGNSWKSTFSPGKIRVIENEQDVSTGELLSAEVRYRGSSALSYAKKAFAVKLKDENRESINRSYFGLRDDNYWILDAMAVDRSRMRNRISTDLWNDFSVDPYFKSQEPAMINGTRGQYVEVFLDDEYWGLYCMTERIDRKQLKLKKYQEENQNIRGVLYKSVQWSNSVMMGKMGGGSYDFYYDIPSFNNWRESWDNYEIKYPDLEDGELVDWEPLYDVVHFVVNSDNSTFSNGIKNKIDFPVWIDYYLFM